MELDFQEIRELLAILNQTDIAEITIKSTEFELTVRKDAKPPAAVPVDYRPPAPEAAIAPPLPPPAAIAPPIAPPPPPPATTSRTNDRLVEVVSPMVGTFYRSPAPDEPPFVDVGDRIRSGQAVCIIEAMKLMNEIEAEIAGEVVEILVENSQPVEFGQVLMRVNPG